MRIEKFTRSSSSSFFSDLAWPTLKTSQLVLYFSASISHILKLSNGRYKALGLIQNMAELYKQCMLEYLNFYRIREWPVAVKNAHALQASMKNGRKFFRLFRWLEEMGKVEDMRKKKWKTEIFLKLFRHFVGVFYYFFDNLVWALNIGIISEPNKANNNHLDHIKDTLSLLRYLLRIVIFFITAHSKIQKESNLRMDLLTNPEKKVWLNNKECILIRKMIKARSKRRFQFIEMTINILRIIMLFKSLQLPGAYAISKVFYSVCGVVSGALALFKLLTHKSSPIVTYNPN